MKSDLEAALKDVLQVTKINQEASPSGSAINIPSLKKLSNVSTLSSFHQSSEGWLFYCLVTHLATPIKSTSLKTSSIQTVPRHPGHAYTKRCCSLANGHDFPSEGLQGKLLSSMKLFSLEHNNPTVICVRLKKNKVSLLCS